MFKMSSTKKEAMMKKSYESPVVVTETVQLGVFGTYNRREHDKKPGRPHKR